MRFTSPYCRLSSLVSSLLLGSAVLSAQGQATVSPSLTPEQMEDFLRTAKILRTRAASKGVTHSMRATLSDGRLTHDAHIQTIDEAKPQFQGDRGTEINFRDTWKFNVAAYRLGNMLGLDNIPVSVERKVGGRNAAVTWWVDDILMDEVTRYRKKIRVPNPDYWNDQIYIVRVFDQLIYNTDRNLQNLLITKAWKVWIIDHTRAFRLYTTLKAPKDLVKCDRKLLAALRRLREEALTRKLTPYLTKPEIRGLLGRRDRIVKRFEQLCAEKGEAAVLYDFNGP